MPSLEKLENKIERYKILKNNLNSIISKLAMAIDNVENLKNEIKDKYQVDDGNTPIISRTTQLKQNMKSTYDYLSSKVIPAIDLALHGLDEKVENKKEGKE